MNILQDIINGVLGMGTKGAAKPVAKGPAPLQQMNTGIPIGQAMTPENIAGLPADVQPLAQIYNANPQDPRVAGLDPAMFGYAPDNTGSQPSAGRPFNPIYPADQAGAVDQFSQGFAPIKVTRR